MTYDPYAPPVVSTPTKVCPRCSTQAMTDGGFCPNCGASYSKRSVGKRAKLVAVAAVAVVLLVAGAVVGLLMKHSDNQAAAKHKAQAAAASSSAATARRSASASAASASAAADAKKVQDDVDRADRKSLVDSLQASVTKDAKKDVNDGILDGPIKHTECTPTNGASDLLKASNTFSCTAVTTVDSDGTERGYAFAAMVDWSGEKYSWHLGH